MFRFSLAGKLNYVFTEAKKAAAVHFKTLGDNKVATSGLEKVNKLIDSFKGDFPDDSDAGLNLAVDAGEKHMQVTQLNFQASHPVPAADLENNPVPDKGPTNPDTKSVEPVKEAKF